MNDASIADFSCGTMALIAGSRASRMSSRGKGRPGDSQGSGERGYFSGEFAVVDIDADARDGVGCHGLHEDAGHLTIGQHEIVGPAQVANQAGSFEDGGMGGEPEGEREERRLREDERAVDAVAGGRVPGVAVAALSGGLLFGEDDVADGKAGGRGHGGVDGLVVVDGADGEGAAEAVHVEGDHRRKRCRVTEPRP